MTKSNTTTRRSFIAAGAAASAVVTASGISAVSAAGMEASPELLEIVRKLDAAYAESNPLTQLVEGANEILKATAPPAPPAIVTHIPQAFGGWQREHVRLVPYQDAQAWYVRSSWWRRDEIARADLAAIADAYEAGLQKARDDSGIDAIEAEAERSYALSTELEALALRFEVRTAGDLVLLAEVAQRQIADGGMFDETPNLLIAAIMRLFGKVGA